jgi:hypothetical protein
VKAAKQKAIQRDRFFRYVPSLASVATNFKNKYERKLKTLQLR